ncbi:molybdate ABC transporter substrate-binding protein [Neomegalonema perideroedes]|uniref:molybdate ABC transporter substrate-binding protein n=1 Tax=Neomegalonema perideroedes TaxID=217219 RepID=UPI000367CE63|nr:molybdate ABC transporter substrate-binding protein [Neomegalonema perideroedes]
MKFAPLLAAALVGLPIFAQSAFAQEAPRPAPVEVAPATLTVAVAANFKGAMEVLAEDFHKETGHTVVPAFGASGGLTTQIREGAPFDAFLSADDERPELLEKEGLGVVGTRFTYAIGTLALWTPREKVELGAEGLKNARLVSIANPKTAPYGAAAMEVIENLGLTADLEGKIAQGGSIGEAFASTASGAADMGFIALSQIKEGKFVDQGSLWLPPAEIYAPIRQDAILIKDTPAGREFVEYLRGAPSAHAIIERFGYELAEEPALQEPELELEPAQ